ncbi:MAG TPA: type II secretion system F family protein [Phycicoccus sp.]|nr:type II secretion system F family protein [Phycicoccus sp.]
MTGPALGLLLGAGLFLIWSSFWVPNREVGRAPNRLRRRLQDEVIQSEIRGLSVPGLLGGCLLAFALVFLLLYAVIGAAPIALSFALMAGWGPLALVRFRARRRRARLRELWPDAIDNVASGVRAGLSLPEALGQLSRRGPAELRGAFGGFAEDYRLTGRFHDSLDLLKERLSDPVGDRLIESLRIAREVGGSDLGRLLRTLSVFLREDARTRSELEARQSWTVSAARLAVAAPWLVLLMLSTRPESVSAYSTVTGVMVLLFGAGVSAFAYWAMVRIGRLPEEERVLR